MRSPSAPSRPREAFELFEEGKPHEETQAIRWFKQEGQDQHGESWISMVKVGGEDLYHVDVAEEVGEEEWDDD